MRTRVALCRVAGPQRLVDLVELAAGDLVDAGAIAELELVRDPGADTLSVTVELEAENGADCER